MTDGPVLFSQVKPVTKTQLLFVQSTATECFIAEGNNLGIFEWLQHVNIGYFMPLLWRFTKECRLVDISKVHLKDLPD